MAFALVAVGAGIGISPAAAPGTAFGGLTWSGVTIATIGLAACVLATLRLMSPLDVPELDPKKLIDEYERRQSDEIYRSLAVAGADACRDLTKRVNRRCRWLYVSLLGFPLVLTGVILLWIDSI